MHTQKRILVITNDAIVRDNFTKPLYEENYEVVVTTDRLDSLDRVIAIHPHVVIIDHPLRRIADFRLMKCLRHVEPKTPIIVCTAEVGLEVKRHAQELGVVRFLNRPFTYTDLAQAIAQALRGPYAAVSTTLQTNLSLPHS